MNLVTVLDGISSIRTNLHLPSTRMGRRFRNILTRDGVCVNVAGLEVWGSLQHQYYFLDSLHGGNWEDYAGELFRKALSPGANVLDLGANIGYYSLLAAKAGGTVQAFEPDPRNIHYLLRNVRCNKLSHRVRVVQKAVTDKIGTVSFYPHESLLESSLFQKLAPGEPMSVECTTVDVSVDERVAVDLIKIDVEGAELNALRGMDRTIARASKTLKMFIECYPAGLQAAGASPAILLDWLDSRSLEAMAIDEKNRCLQPLDSIDLQFPKFQDEPVRAFNLYCVRKGTSPS